MHVWHDVFLASPLVFLSEGFEKSNTYSYVLYGTYWREGSCENYSILCSIVAALRASVRRLLIVVPKRESEEFSRSQVMPILVNCSYERTDKRMAYRDG